VYEVSICFISSLRKDLNLHIEHHGLERLEVLQHCLVLEQSGIDSVVLDASSHTNTQVPAIVGVRLLRDGLLQSDEGANH
jgi:hypothetical protein